MPISINKAAMHDTISGTKASVAGTFTSSPLFGVDGANGLLVEHSKGEIVYGSVAVPSPDSVMQGVR